MNLFLGTFDCKKGRVFVSYKEKQGALNALETMLITKEYHLQVSKNSTVRKNDYNVVANTKDSMESSEFNGDLLVGGSSNNTPMRNEKHHRETSSSSNAGNVPNGINGHSEDFNKDMMHQHLNHVAVTAATSIVSPPNNFRQHRDHSRSREPSLVPVGAVPPPNSQLSLTSPLNLAAAANMSVQNQQQQQQQQQPPLPPMGGLDKVPPPSASQLSKTNGLVKFNRNVEKDIFGYYCLSFLNEDGDINEKKVRHDFGKFGEVVSVRGALGKQKGHVFVRFRRKEAAENCLNCLNSFPLSEMSELFGKYLYLSPATPRDIDCDMYGLYSISFLNLNMKTFREIRTEFSKFGEIVRLTSGGSGNTDELVSISYSDKNAAVKALQTHFTNKEFPYLDIAKGSSLLLVNSSDSSDNEDNESDYSHLRMDFNNGSDMGGPSLRQMPIGSQISQQGPRSAAHSSSRKDPFHDPSPIQAGPPGSDVVDELLKPFQSYFNTYRTGQYHSPLVGDLLINPDRGEVPFNPQNNAQLQQQQQQQPPPTQQQQQAQQQQKSPEKKYRIKSMPKMPNGAPSSPNHVPMQKPPSPSVSRNEPKRLTNFHMNGQESEVSRVVPSQDQQQQQQPSNDNSSATMTKNESPEPESPEETREIGPLEVDVFGLYSLTFINKAKDLSERKVRLDFSKYGDIARIRGQFNNSGEIVIVSFNDKESAEKAVQSPSLASKYGPSLNTCPYMDVVPDKDGHFSIEFINSGMSGIREITNEFSKHGEVMKVMAGGAKNAIKRVTVSFADRNAAFAAVKAHETSKDFVSIDFSRECLLAHPES